MTLRSNALLQTIRNFWFPLTFSDPSSLRGRRPTNELFIIQIIQTFSLWGSSLPQFLSPTALGIAALSGPLTVACGYLGGSVCVSEKNIGNAVATLHFVNTHLSNASLKKGDQEIDGMGSRSTQFIVVKSIWIATSLQPSNSLRVSSCWELSFSLVHSSITILNRDWNIHYLPKLWVAQARLRYRKNLCKYYTGSVV